jgi:multidrug efflux system outer membrane protein
MKRVFALAAMGLMAGCAVGPDYVAPKMPAPEHYSAKANVPISADAAALWWKGFGDDALNGFVDKALADNLDLATAQARLQAAVAQVRIARSGRYPSLDTSLGGNYQRDLAGDRKGNYTAGLNGGLSLDWRPDLFGGQFRALQAAQAGAARSEALRNDVARLTVASVAETYIQLRRGAAQLELIDTSLDLQTQTLNIVRQRQQAGLAADVDVTRAAAEVASTRARRGPITLQLESARNTLTVLIGQPPHGVAITDSPNIPVFAGGPDIGMPGDLLRRRPDVAAAEQSLVQATAGIGVATSALYPALSLPADLTASLTHVSPGDAVERMIGAISGAIGVPLFDMGGRRAEVDVAKANAQAALFTYRQTLLDALREVETAMVSIESATSRRDNLAEAVKQSEAAFDQANALYREGLADFIDILDAQRTLISNRQSLVDAESDLALAIVDLYAAAGAPVTVARPQQQASAE